MMRSDDDHNNDGEIEYGDVDDGSIDKVDDAHNGELC